MSLSIFKKQVIIQKEISSLFTEWEGRESSRWTVVPETLFIYNPTLYSYSATLLDNLTLQFYSKVVVEWFSSPSSSSLKLSVAPDWTQAQLMLQMDAAQRKKKKLTKTNKLWHFKLSASQPQSGFLWLLERYRRRTNKTICTSIFMCRTLASQANLAQNPTHPFMQMSLSCWDFCPARALVVVLFVPEVSSFQETPMIRTGLSLWKTGTVLISTGTQSSVYLSIPWPSCAGWHLLPSRKAEWH